MSEQAAKAVPDDGANTGWPALFRDGNAAISVMLAGGVAIHALSLRVVATVLPTVVGEIGGLRFFAWTTTVATVGAIWGAALAAWLARARGLRTAYRVSLASFATGSVVCALAPDMAVFLVGRLFQGIGGGLLTALAYATIRRVFAEALRTRAIVLVSGIWGVAAFCGPLLGGVMAGLGHWRWAFWIDVPVAAVLVVLTEYSLPRTADPDAGAATMRAGAALGRLALLGAAVLAVALGSITGGAASGGIGLAIGIGLLLTLLRIEHGEGSAGFRLLPSDAYRSGSVLGAVTLAMALMVGSTMSVLYLPYVIVEVGGYPPIVGGYLSALLAVSWTLASFATASAARKGAVRSMLGGAALVVLGQVVVGGGLSSPSLVPMATGLVLLGGGIGIAWAHLGNLLMTHARDTERDISSTFISTNQLIAQSFSAALAGMIANLGGFADLTHDSARVVSSVAGIFYAFALVAAAALPAMLMAVRLSGRTGAATAPGSSAGDARSRP
jgi:MFS family permease